MSQLNRDQLVAVARISIAVLDSVEEAGEIGAPAGPLYAAMQAQGATLSQFQSLMGTLTRPAYLALEDDCYFTPPKTAAFKATLQRTVASFGG